MKRTGWRDNSIEGFIERHGIDENLTDKEVYEKYKTVTDDPYTKTMFTRYLIEHKGYEKVRLMILGKRGFYYKKT